MIHPLPIDEELRQLKQDNGLLKLSNEQLAHNFKMADDCAHEREIQILALLRERETMAALLEAAVTSMQDSGYSNYHPIVREIRALLSRLGRGK